MKKVVIACMALMLLGAGSYAATLPAGMAQSKAHHGHKKSKKHKKQAKHQKHAVKTHTLPM